MIRSALATVAWLLLFLVATVARAQPARMETVQAPAGGRPIALGEGRVACGSAGGWTVEREGHALRPPPAGSDIVGKRASVRIAPNAAGCASTNATLTAIATGPLPVLDAAGSTIWVDDARFELRGKNLEGVRIRWRAGTRQGEDVCDAPKEDGTSPATAGSADVLPAHRPSPERGRNLGACIVASGRGLTADPSALSLDWAPRGGITDEGTLTFDAEGRRLGETETRIAPGRIVVTHLFPTPASVDLTSGALAKMPLIHPEAISSVDCAPATCKIESGALVVQSVTHQGASLTVKAKLLPRVTTVKGTGFEAAPSVEIALLRCPLSVVGAPPLRDVDDTRLVVRLEGNCAREARSLKWFVDERAADTLQVETDKDTAHVLIRVGRLEGQQVSVRANRPEPDRTVLGVARAKTRSAPLARATLQLVGIDETIDFIPVNRTALVRTPEPGEGARLVVLPVEGVYTASKGNDGTSPASPERGRDQMVQALGPAGGYAALRLAYRATSLPGTLAEANLAILEDPVRHPIREANVPVSLGGDKLPICELECVNREGKVRVVPMGVPWHVREEERDGCRIVLHRERLRPDDGAQRLLLDINVTRVDGSARPEARLTQSFVLRPGAEPRVAWLRGAVAPYDRISVGITHIADESHYVSRSEQPLTPPAAQWTVLTGTSIARLYLTAAIPTVLYRVADKASSGVLSLNFGVIGRLTWLDSQGNEGFLALEGGVTGVGLAPVVDASTQNQRQVATVAGIGLGVPIANRALASQASINLHAWFSYEISRDLADQAGSAIGFLFGPSISIGNIGTNL
jgi:hypothetical protein